MAVDAKLFDAFLVHMAFLSDYDTFKFYLFFEGVTPPTEVEFKLESINANIDTDFQSITSGTNNIDCPDYPGSDSSNEAVMKVTVTLIKIFPLFPLIGWIFGIKFDIRCSLLWSFQLSPTKNGKCSV